MSTRVCHCGRAVFVTECVACGRECPPHLRWCSTRCFYDEDGYPDERDDDDTDEEETR